MTISYLIITTTTTRHRQTQSGETLVVQLRPIIAHTTEVDLVMFRRYNYSLSSHLDNLLTIINTLKKAKEKVVVELNYPVYLG